jgi:nitrite reductase/ring-hydroxylating ferredoxin subunit
MADFVPAAPLEQVPPGTATTVCVNGTEVALFNVGGTVYALQDGCAHAGSSLGAGELGGSVVRCRGHGWTYDLRTGFVCGIDGFGVPTYPVKVVDGQILIAGI